MQFATTSKSGVGNSPGGIPPDAGTAFAGHADALLKSGEGGSRDEHTVRAAARTFFNRGRRVAVFWH